VHAAPLPILEICERRHPDEEEREEAKWNHSVHEQHDLRMRSPHAALRTGLRFCGSRIVCVFDVSEDQKGMLTPDTIARIGIDRRGRLYVKPGHVELNLIERAAMNVGWDKANARLFAPMSPSDYELATPEWWFARIVEAAKMQGYALKWTCHTALDAESGIRRWKLFLAYLGTKYGIIARMLSTSSAAVRDMADTVRSVPGTFNVAFAKGFPLVILRGDIDLGVAEALREALAREVPSDSRVTLFDFGEVSWLDSSGLGALLQHLKPPRRGIFFCVQPWIIKFFQMINFKKPPFELAPNLNGALQRAQRGESLKEGIPRSKMRP
jgi:anti-anti-sigma factor